MVSISTAVWMVMCSDPVTRTPASGLPAAYLLRIDISPGISCSAMSISLRPNSAKPISATLYSAALPNTALSMVAFAIEKHLVEIVCVYGPQKPLRLYQDTIATASSEAFYANGEPSQ